MNLQNRATYRIRGWGGGGQIELPKVIGGGGGGGQCNAGECRCTETGGGGEYIVLYAAIHCYMGGVLYNR